jgi:hypothetical protein
LVSPLSLKLSVSAIIDDAETVGTDLWRANVGDMKKLTIVSVPWIYSKHAHLLWSFLPDIGKIPFLKLFVSMIIDYLEAVSKDLQRATVGNMKKVNNCINPSNIQWAYSPSLQLYIHSRL